MNNRPVKRPLYDRPLTRDWLFWWSLIVLGFAFIATLREDYPQGLPVTSFYLTAFAIDFGLRAFFYFLILALIPGWIRRRIRGRRASLALGSSGTAVDSASAVGALEGVTPQQNGKPIRVQLLIAGIAVIGLLFGDWLMRNIEMNRLLAVVESSEKAMIEGMDEMRAINVRYSTFLADVRREWFSLGSNPVAGRFRSEEQVLNEWREKLEEAASDTAAKVIETAVEVRELTVLPWHLAILRARSSYLDHSREWEELLTEVAQGEEAKRRPAIDATFKVAERAFRRAVPSFPLFRIEDRIAEIF
jgi:hypothetical protein